MHMQAARQPRPAQCRRVACRAARSPASIARHAAAEEPVAHSASRRGIFAAAAALAPGLLLAAPGAARADWFAQDLTRKAMRPNTMTPEQAAVVFLDARSTLRDIEALAATAADSPERFQGRKEWPGFAKWLRGVGPAAPVLAAIASGSSSGEETLSSEYGGSGDQPGVTDGLYIAFGRVLTISGRTIKEEAQLDPALARDARDAVQGILDKLPKELLESAQAARVARAAGAKKA